MTKETRVVTVTFEVTADETMLAPLANENILEDLAYRTMREFNRDLAKITGRSAWNIIDRVIGTTVAEA